MANLTLMFGFGVISLVGGIYYVLPRLTGTRLRSAGLAGSGLLGISGLVVFGLLVIGFGVRQRSANRWDSPGGSTSQCCFSLTLPLIITVGTINNREEQRSFVTLWFVIAGVVWLPLLYLAYFIGELPSLSAVAVEYSNVFLSAGFVTMFLFTVGTGLFYYTLVKELDVSLASRQLALVGFWSLGFAAAWWGAAQLIFGPAPSWVAGVAAALGLAFPIGTLANAANASLTLEGSWSELSKKTGSVSRNLWPLSRCRRCDTRRSRRIQTDRIRHLVDFILGSCRIHRGRRPGCLADRRNHFLPPCHVWSVGKSPPSNEPDLSAASPSSVQSARFSSCQPPESSPAIHGLAGPTRPPTSMRVRAGRRALAQVSRHSCS